MSDFLSDHGVVVALVCALFAVAYGLLTSRSLLGPSRRERDDARPVGGDRGGCSAYLRHQYTTIAIVGVVLFVLLLILQDIGVAIGFLVAACCPPRPASSA